MDFLDEGWDFRVYTVDGKWLFRLPKRESSASKLNMERRLLLGLREWVSLPVPSYDYFCESPEIPGRAFGGYRIIPGVGGDTAKTVDLPELARQLGSFLTELHSYPVDEARRARVPEARDVVLHWRDRACTQLSTLDDLPIDSGRLREFLEENAPLPLTREACLVHGDLWALHILLDSRSGRASGIIDWGDAAIGDRAIDFACLYTWRGESWVEKVLTHYTGELDPEVVPRSRYLATCLAIHNITLGRELRRDPWIEDGLKALRLTRVA